MRVLKEAVQKSTQPRRGSLTSSFEIFPFFNLRTKRNVVLKTGEKTFEAVHTKESGGNQLADRI